MGSDQRSLLGTSQEVQWLRLQASNAGGTGSAPGQGTKIPHAAQCKDKKKFEYIKKKNKQVLWTTSGGHLSGYNSTPRTAPLSPLGTTGVLPRSSAVDLCNACEC